MKVDMNQKIKNMDGSVAKEGDKEITLGVICANALLATIPNENPTGPQKYERFGLATKIHASKDGMLEISVENLAMLREMIGKGYSTLVVGQAYDLLDGKTPEV